MKRFDTLRAALSCALPVMLSYVVIGLACGVMSAASGLTPLMCLLLSATFYSGAGQFMIAPMLLAGSSLPSVIASVILVSTRQLLYSAAFSPYFKRVSRAKTLLFALFVTDESFGIIMDKFAQSSQDQTGALAASGKSAAGIAAGQGAGEAMAKTGGGGAAPAEPATTERTESDGVSHAASTPWTVNTAIVTNILCMLAWALAVMAGAMVGSAVSLPVALMSFGMTSIFICLLVGQPRSGGTLACVVGAFAGVLASKLAGWGSVAILLGAIAGVVAGLAYEAATESRRA